jgi:hypothetical protein
MTRLTRWFKEVTVPINDSEPFAFGGFQGCVAWWWAFGWRMLGLVLAVGQLASGLGLRGNGRGQVPADGTLIALALALTIWQSVEGHPKPESHGLPWPVHEQFGLLAGVLMLGLGMLVGGTAFIIGSIPAAALDTIKIRRRASFRTVIVVFFCMGVFSNAVVFTHNRLVWSVLMAVALTCALEVGLWAAKQWWRGWMTAAIDEMKKLKEKEDLEINESIFTIHNRLVHDLFLPILDRLGVGHPVREDDRALLMEAATTFRREALGDYTPRWARTLIDTAVNRAGALHVALSTADYITGEPPGKIILAFEDALSALITNLSHAQVKEARLSVNARDDYLHVTLADDGVGMDSETTLRPTTRKRVIRRLEELGATAAPTTSPGGGTTWHLSWGSRDAR